MIYLMRVSPFFFIWIFNSFTANIMEYINDALKVLRNVFISNLKTGLEDQG